jgi:hypothetical protein
MAAINALSLGTLMYPSGLVPRAIRSWDWRPTAPPPNLGTMFGVNDEVCLWSAIALAPIVFREYPLGVWPVLKGFKPTPITTRNNPSQAMPADLSRT